MPLISNKLLLIVALFPAKIAPLPDLLTLKLERKPPDVEELLGANLLLL